MPLRLPTRFSRRPFLTAAVCIGAAASIVATTGVAASASPSARAAVAVTSTLAGPVLAAPLSWSADALTTSTADARATLDRAEAVSREADALNAEVAASGLDLGDPAPIDTAELDEVAERLSSTALVPALIFPERASDVDAETAAVDGRVSELRDRLDTARAAKAAADAAAEAQRQAEAEAAAEAQRRADALAAANTPEGAKATARAMAAERHGWGDAQFACLSSLWQKESGWNYRAYNASSGATGIPQALPGSKMAAAGDDWQANASTQIAWGLDYIARAYGAPCAAWGHSQATNWY
jgi:hypothetical protein